MHRGDPPAYLILSDGPLFRVNLIRLGDEEWVLVLVMHHIISDGHSFGVLFNQLEEFYSMFTEGHIQRHPANSIQYADFAFWWRQKLEGKTIAKQIEYWKGRLGEGGSALELPTDKPRPTVQSSNGARQLLSIPLDLREQIARVGRGERATLFMTMLAAVQTLLYRYTGQSPIAVGTPVSIRTRSEFEDMIGLFLNIIVLSTDFSEGLTFRQLLGRVRQAALDAFTNQDLPFEHLVSILQPERDPSRNPLFQVLLQISPSAKLKFHGLAITPFEFDKGTSQFDLSFHLFEEEGSLKGFIEYDTDLFESYRIKQMAAHLDSLLLGIVADPDQTIAELPLLTEQEKKHYCLKTGTTRTEPIRGMHVSMRFLRGRLSGRPTAVALVL